MAAKAMQSPVVFHVVGALSGEALCTVHVERSLQVRALKEELSRHLETTPPVVQRLLLGDRCLNDSEKLSDVLPHGVVSSKVSLLRAAAEASALQKIEEGRLELEDLSEELRGNRDIVLAAVRTDGMALEYASKELQCDFDVVLAAVGESGAALRHASTQARGDKGIVLTAVQQYGQAFQYASEELRGDWDVGICAVKKNWKALRFATIKLSGDAQFMLTALRESRNPEVFRELAACLRRDKSFFLVSVREYPLTFAYADSALQFDRNVVLEVVRVNGRAIGFASDEVKNDAEVMAAAVRSAPDAAYWAWNYNSYGGRD